ncbi:MAG: CDGSH iron-sulfur domain-containing protein [Candidatus Marsarchaeota archaeon]|nr:CDGSH iron-sulfur domain-containing protein [Candidatus Marsarchaeota archaeon]MCL5102221.1 CDGSH iron-sulfur domain-containing protein [Candidatus Marsarchaeota archaeon]
MSRYVRHDRNHPFVVKLGSLPGFSNLTQDEKLRNFEIHICACGLSKNKPFCDGTHMKTHNEKEGMHYAYKEGNAQMEGVKLEDKEHKELEVPNEYE